MNRGLLTSSQTVGPFFAPALLRKDAVRHVLVQPETVGERVFIQGLVQEADRAVLERTGTLVLIRPRSHDDHRRGVTLVAKAALEFDAGHSRHVQVDDQASGRVAVKTGEKFQRRAVGLGGERAYAQKARERFEHRRVVVDDRDARNSTGHAG